MHRPVSSLLIGLVIALPATAGAQAVSLVQGQPYMAMVGELVGAIESPRVVMETCVAGRAGRRAEYQRAYEAWRTRHASVLAQVEAQLARADERLQRDNPESGARSVADAMNRILQRRYESLDPGPLRQLCDRYPDMLRAKDVEMETSVPELLRRVAAADGAGGATK